MVPPSPALQGWAAGDLGDPWIVQGPAHQTGWGEGRVRPSLLPFPQSNGPSSGELSRCPRGLPLRLVPAWGLPWPTVAQAVAWLEAWPSGLVQRQPVPALASPSSVQGLFLLPAVWRAPAVPHFHLRFLSRAGPMVPRGKASALIIPVFINTRTSVPTPLS